MYMDENWYKMKLYKMNEPMSALLKDRNVKS